MHARVVDLGLNVVGNRPDQVAQHDRLRFQRQFPAFRAGHAQQVVDTPVQFRGAGFDGRKRVRRSLGVLLADLGLHHDDGQWRAQFVTDVGEKASPVFVDFSQRFVGGPQFFGSFCDGVVQARPFRFDLRLPVQQRAGHPVGFAV